MGLPGIRAGASCHLRSSSTRPATSGSALESYQWFKFAVVACWGERWTITAEEVFRWLDQWRRERPEASAEAVAIVEHPDDDVGDPGGPGVAGMQRPDRGGSPPC